MCLRKCHIPRGLIGADRLGSSRRVSVACCFLKGRISWSGRPCNALRQDTAAGLAWSSVVDLGGLRLSFGVHERQSRPPRLLALRRQTGP
jgi:hypothetical protein